MNRYAVFGVGSFGRNVVRALFEQDQEVIAVDMDADSVESCTEFCSQAVVADATDKKALKALSIEMVDVAIVSLGERIDVITLAALHLVELGVPYVAVKAVSEDHEKILKALGVNEVIQPEKQAAVRLGTKLAMSHVMDVLQVVPGYAVVSMRATGDIVGRRVTELESDRIQVVMIHHLHQSMPALVPPDEEEENDLLMDQKIKNDGLSEFLLGSQSLLLRRSSV